MKKYSMRACAAAVVLAAAMLVSACGSSESSGSYVAAPQEAAAESSAEYRGDAAAGGNSAAYEEDYAADTVETEESAGVEEAGIRQAQDGEKIIYTANLEIQTLGYEESVKSIRRKITAAGGFIEAEYESDNNRRWYEESSGGNRYLSLTVRIPSENFESFLESLEGDGKVLSRNVNATNISQRYSDMEATKKALEIEQERLLGMMDKAETIEDMIAVEARLSEVERELNNYRTQLSGMDRDVQYSTVYVNLEEVKKYSPQVQEVSYVERLQEAAWDAVEGFKTFLQDFSVWIVRHFPFLIIAALIIALIVRRIRKSRERRAQMLAAGGVYTGTPVKKRRIFKRRGEENEQVKTDGEQTDKEP